MNELINLLEKQEENLNLLLEIITGYQKAIVAGDLPAMEQFLDKEQKSLSSIQSNQEIQITLIQVISTKNNLNLSTFSVGHLIESLPLGIHGLNKLKYFRKSLKTLATVISEKNRLNEILINHSRNFIKEIITTLLHNNKNLLDRKI
jgi:hypothetical protein